MKEKEIIPLKELVPFEVFQTIFEQLMENADRRMSEEESENERC